MLIRKDLYIEHRDNTQCKWKKHNTTGIKGGNTRMQTKKHKSNHETNSSETIAERGERQNKCFIAKAEQTFN